MGTIPDLPDACAIVGGGVIAVEYATVLASLGVDVSLLCKDEVLQSVLTSGYCWVFVLAMLLNAPTGRAELQRKN